MKKKNIDELDDDLRPHYDFANMPIVKRGPGYAAKSKIIRSNRVQLAPDVAAAFPDEASVNQALRLLIQAREIGKKAA
jgi:hypothetical protein